ncbi:MAG: serine hydrolase [Candidatus Omnitrophota bacterium]
MKKSLNKKVIIILLTITAGICTYAIWPMLAPEKCSVQTDEKVEKIRPAFEEYAKKEMANWKIPGMAIAIVKDDKIVYAKGFGVKTIGTKDPVNEKTIFQIGSTSKAFTAALVAMMVDQGKMKWKDKVIDHVPDFQMYDPWVTREFMVEELLEQHSGLPPYSGDFQAIAGFDREHIKHSLRFIKPVTSFRSEFAYVNNLFLVAAEAVEKHTGKSWEENVTERIFKPLGMKDSSTGAEPLMRSQNAATGHSLERDEVKLVPKDLKWMYIYGPAGGINSNVLDMAKWVSLQINDGTFQGKRLVSADNFDYIHSPKTIANSDSRKGPLTFYCASWVYEDTKPYPMVWHNGGTTGYHTMVAFWPDAKIGMVVLTNHSSNSLAEALPRYFSDLYFGNPAKDWSEEAFSKMKKAAEEGKAKEPKPPAQPVPPMALEKYAGTYQNDIYGDVTVDKKGDGLEMTAGPDKFKILLKHWDKDVFTSVALGEEAKADVVFTTGADGSVSTMTMNSINQDGCGIFQKK